MYTHIHVTRWAGTKSLWCFTTSGQCMISRSTFSNVHTHARTHTHTHTHTCTHAHTFSVHLLLFSLFIDKCTSIYMSYLGLYMCMRVQNIWCVCHMCVCAGTKSLWCFIASGQLTTSRSTQSSPPYAPLSSPTTRRPSRCPSTSQPQARGRVRSRYSYNDYDEGGLMMMMKVA